MIQNIMNKFNFDYEGKRYPNYRVEYAAEGGAPSVSSPAIFDNDEEAKEAALKEFPSWQSIGMNTVKVLKYTKQGLKEVFRKVF